MSQKLFGKTDSLKSSYKKALQKLYRRSLPKGEVFNLDIAQELSELSRELGRVLGLLVNRRSKIEAVIVGDSNQIYLPDIGRFRGGGKRLRGLSLIQTKLSSSKNISRDSLNDLKKLRFDLLFVFSAEKSGRPGWVRWSHLERAKLEPFVSESEPIYQAHFPDISFIEDIENQLAIGQKKRKKVSDGNQIILVHCFQTSEMKKNHIISENEQLADTAGFKIEERFTQIRQSLDHAYLMGKGKIEELAQVCLELNPDYVVFGHNLAPSQVRNIENIIETPVLDRTQLILDIFGRHAKTTEAMFQVEMARLRYQLPRLATKSTMLSRITGGIGGRGPGETKWEIYRRQAQDRIHTIDKKLQKYKNVRLVNQQKRSKNPNTVLISVVGYTNAGKSTFLKSLCRSEDIIGEDKLFATLEPKSRRYNGNQGIEFIFSDTVGFIEDMPKDLRKAFASTFSEISSADLILHLIDGSDFQMKHKRRVVLAFLKDMDLGHVPVLEVFNKSDIAVHPSNEEELWISAQNKQGFDSLLRVLAARAKDLKAPESFI